MGRPERPIPPEIAARAVGQLALYLRRGRQQAGSVRNGKPVRGVSYAELARRTGYGASTLQRAASGQRVPARRVVSAYADACGLDRARADLLWHEARRQEHRSTAGVHTAGIHAVAVELVRNQAELGAALVALHERSGAPSLRIMEERARRAGAAPLSRSGIQRTLARRRIPVSAEELATFLLACRVPQEQQPVWLRAWRRARRQQRWELTATRRLLLRLEVEAAGPPGRITAARAIGLAQDAGYLPVERYRGFTSSWTVRCMSCSTVRRVRLSDLARDRGGCTCTETESSNTPDGHAESAVINWALPP